MAKCPVCHRKVKLIYGKRYCPRHGKVNDVVHREEVWPLRLCTANPVPRPCWQHATPRLKAAMGKIMNF